MVYTCFGMWGYNLIISMRLLEFGKYLYVMPLYRL